MSGNVIDDMIDDFIIENNLGDRIPLTSDLQKPVKKHKHIWKNGIHGVFCNVTGCQATKSENGMVRYPHGKTHVVSGRYS